MINTDEYIIKGVDYLIGLIISVKEWFRINDITRDILLLIGTILYFKCPKFAEIVDKIVGFVKDLRKNGIQFWKKRGP